MPSPQDIWRRTTPQPCDRILFVAVNFWNGFLQADGENPKISQAPLYTCVHRRATMCTDTCWPWTADGWLAKRRNGFIHQEKGRLPLGFCKPGRSDAALRSGRLSHLDHSTLRSKRRRWRIYVARGLKRCFGLETAIVTSFAKNPVGLLLQDLIYQGGVDSSLIRWVDYDGG